MLRLEKRTQILWSGSTSQVLCCALHQDNKHTRSTADQNSACSDFPSLEILRTFSKCSVQPAEQLNDETWHTRRLLLLQGALLCVKHTTREKERQRSKPPRGWLSYVILPPLPSTGQLLKLQREKITCCRRTSGGVGYGAMTVTAKASLRLRSPVEHSGYAPRSKSCHSIFDSIIRASWIKVSLMNYKYSNHKAISLQTQSIFMQISQYKCKKWRKVSCVL